MGIFIHILDGKALVKLVDPEQLQRARDEKRALAEARAAKRADTIKAEREKRLARLEKGRLPPSEMFKPPNVSEGTFGSYDDSGIPLTDGEGKPLSKNATKKLQREFANQAKIHKEFLDWQTNEGS